MMNCNHEGAYHFKKYFGVKLEDGSRGDIELCNLCGAANPGDAGSPDVYWPGHSYQSPNLCDEMGKPYELTSKREKARVMKELGVSEAGDKLHGAPVMPQTTWTEGSRDYRRKSFEADRPNLQKIYREWRERARR